MSNKLLLTSFQTWLSHQKFNSSDRLLEIVQTRADSNLYFSRQLPVETNLAARQVIAVIEKINPEGIICCGMAESRSQLTVESNAECDYPSGTLRDRECIFTKVDLEKLIACLNNTKISHNAGKFVCEGLYYQVLKYINLKQVNIPCIFVHIPLLDANNSNVILQDFTAIIDFMRAAKV